MNYIAVDLKAIEVGAPGLSRALGIDQHAVIGALVMLWHRCWSLKTGTVGRLELRGYFAHPEAPELLCAFGFLETVDEMTWRVKGAERYLRIAEQRQKAGKARAKSAGRSAGKFASGQPAGDQRNTSGEPAADQLSHRAPNTEVKASAPSKPAPPFEPRESDAMCDDFRAVLGTSYKWQGAKDGRAFADLRRTFPLAEIRARWVRGLKAPADAWASCRTVAQLAMKWNDLAVSQKQPDNAPEVFRML